MDRDFRVTFSFSEEDDRWIAEHDHGDLHFFGVGDHPIDATRELLLSLEDDYKFLKAHRGELGVHPRQELEYLETLHRLRPA